MQQGCVLAYVTVPNNQSRATFVQPIAQTLNDCQLMEKLNIDLVCYQRLEDGENSRIPDKPASDYLVNQFICVFECEASNTDKNVQDWGHILAERFTKIAKKYTYPKVLKFAANTLEEDEDGKLPCPDCYLLNEDVMKLIDIIYPPQHYTQKSNPTILLMIFWSK